VDEQVRANEYLSTLDDGLRTVAMPFTLAGYQAPARAARRPGEDDDEVLLGLFSLYRLEDVFGEGWMN
jgi:hypothetical protein